MREGPCGMFSSSTKSRFDLASALCTSLPLFDHEVRSRISQIEPLDIGALDQGAPARFALAVERQPNGEGRSPPFGALDIHATPMQFGEALDDREAKTGSLEGPIICRLR